MRKILRPFSKLYSNIMRGRAKLYQRGILSSYKSKLPVISIGNISAGGTGKTPLCIYLVQKLKEKGFKPAVLSRGYRGSNRGVHLVSIDDSAGLCGDEPLLIAQSTDSPVVIARDRIAGAKFIENETQADLIILDDGLQHIRLKRDVNIVTLNLSNSEDIKDVEENRVIPSGKLREDRDEGISRADIIVFSNRMPQAKAIPPTRDFLKLMPANKIMATSFFEGKDVIQIKSGQGLEPGSNVVVFCGIANPEGFYATLSGLGFEVIKKYPKADHHVFTESEIYEMQKAHPGIPLVCTEKDAVRLPRVNLPEVYKLRGEFKVIPADELINGVISKIKAAT